MSDLKREEGLDPQNWDDFRALSHRALDEMIDHLRTVRDRPVWQPMPPSVRERLATDPPWEGTGLGAVYEEFSEVVQPYALGNIHPRFWGWVPGAGTPGGVLAELLKAGLNSVPAAFDEVGRALEDQVIDWFLRVFGLPRDGSGVLVSGGSVANFVGLAVARDARAGFDVRQEGLTSAPRPLALYASAETHNSVDKAVQLLGLGRTALRKIPVNDRFEIRIDELREAIKKDRAAGYQPIAVVGNAGTVNTAAFDDLTALADLCEAEGLWLHRRALAQAARETGRGRAGRFLGF
jgi:glutamate/tyrosine decarboxylase-like PLP-dependent enzyme